MEAFNSFFYTLFQNKHRRQKRPVKKRKGENNHEEIWKGRSEVPGTDPDFVGDSSGSVSDRFLAYESQLRYALLSAGRD